MIKDILLCAGGLIAIFVVPTIMVVVLFRRGRRRSAQESDAWAELASSLGLSHQTKTFLDLSQLKILGFGLHTQPLFQGSYRGREIALLPFGKREQILGEEEHVYRVLVGIRKKHPGKLSFSRRTAIDRATSLVRDERVRIGDTQFDDKFVIKADSEGSVRQIFSSAFLRQKLMEGPSVSFNILDDRIESYLSHQARDTAFWREAIDLLCDIAEAAEGA